MLNKRANIPNMMSEQLKKNLLSKSFDKQKTCFKFSKRMFEEHQNKALFQCYFTNICEHLRKTATS